MEIRNHRPITALLAAGLYWLPGVNLDAVQGIVTNQEGRSFEGELQLLPDGRLSLEVAADEGSAAYTFSKDSVSGLEFLDAEALEAGLDAYADKQYATAVGLLENVHRERSPFFRIYTHPRLAEPSLTLGKAYLEEERFADAAGVAGVLLGADFTDPTVKDTANEILLMAFFGLERWDETEVLARRWCEQHEPVDDSALGWWILGEVHLARGDFEKARWTSLQPITFSSQFPKAYLRECYHVAITSWLGESPDQALKLYKEYQDRGYEWPEGMHFQTELALSTLALEQESIEEPSPSGDPVELNEGKPEKNLNLPLKEVRKLTSKQESDPSS